MKGRTPLTPRALVLLGALSGLAACGGSGDPVPGATDGGSVTNLGQDASSVADAASTVPAADTSMADRSDEASSTPLVDGASSGANDGSIRQDGVVGNPSEVATSGDGAATPPDVAAGGDTQGPTADASCAGGACHPAHCRNATLDADESDIDCGGTGCAPCMPFRSCRSDADCRGRACDPDGRICLPSCVDGLLDGDESDVDCGGSCGPCRPLRDCRGPEECTTRSCTFSDHADHCQPIATCSNGVRDGEETDVDCGGDYCGPCATGQRCSADADCHALCGPRGSCL